MAAAADLGTSVVDEWECSAHISAASSEVGVFPTLGLSCRQKYITSWGRLQNWIVWSSKALRARRNVGKSVAQLTG